MAKNFIIIDVETAQCEVGFLSKEKAVKHIENNVGNDYTIVTGDNYDGIMEAGKKIIITPCEIVNGGGDVTLLPNTDKTDLFSLVAEYKGDLCNIDILTSDEALKVEIGSLDKFRLELEKPIQQVYEEINTKCNDFLRTQKGLQYLLMKYPTLSLEQAIREYYANVRIAENYNGTEF